MQGLWKNKIGLKKMRLPQGQMGILQLGVLLTNATVKQLPFVSSGSMHRPAAILPKWQSDLLRITFWAGIVMMAATIFDQSATALLIEYKWPLLSEWMGRTLFEGELPGTNDVLVLLLLAAMVIYLAGWRKKTTGRWAAYRPQAGFILLCALVVAFLVMHGFKLSLGRARPSLVLNHQMPYSNWFVFGPHFIGHGLFRGAFPSGHTAQAFSAMSLAYIMICNPYFSRSIHLLGRLWGAGVLLFSLAMGIARCMSASHWFTDVLGAVCIGWPVMHWLYFGLLLIPGQCRYYYIHGHHPPLPVLWELRIGGFLLLTTIGIILLINSWRALMLEQAYWMTLFMPLAAWLIHRTLFEVINIRQKIRQGLAGY